MKIWRVKTRTYNQKLLLLLLLLSVLVFVWLDVFVCYHFMVNSGFLYRTNFICCCTNRLGLIAGKCCQLGSLGNFKKRLETHLFRCVLWNVLASERLCISYYGSVQVFIVHSSSSFKTQTFIDRYCSIFAAIFHV